MEEDIPLCPRCEHSLDPAIEKSYTTCPKCGERVNLDAQWAYFRGVDAFSEGQDLFMTQPPRKRRIVTFSPIEQEVVNLYTQAYCALQIAFQARLAESQRQLAIEIMANMSQLFLQRNMISPLEANYWSLLMFELTAQREIESILEKLARLKTAGLWGLPVALRWQLRQRQLTRKLADLDVKIQRFERNIAFVEKMYCRRENRSKARPQGTR